MYRSFLIDARALGCRVSSSTIGEGRHDRPHTRDESVLLKRFRDVNRTECVRAVTTKREKKTRATNGRKKAITSALASVTAATKRSTTTTITGKVNRLNNTNAV